MVVSLNLLLSIWLISSLGDRLLAFLFECRFKTFVGTVQK
jgi:hypothetical protein